MRPCICQFVLASACCWSLLSSIGTAADVIVITNNQTVVAKRITVENGLATLIGGKDTKTSDFPIDELQRLIFDPPPAYSPTADWLCLRNGQRLRGDKLVIGPDRVALQREDLEPISAALDDVEAIFFSTSVPKLKTPPTSGVRILSANGDVLNAPFAELTTAGIIVDINPDIDPLLLPRERLQGIIWPADPKQQPQTITSLRTGQQWIGTLVSIDEDALTIDAGDGKHTVPLRDVREVSRQQVRQIPLDDALADKTHELPRHRTDRNALGGPLQIGNAFYASGVGIRGGVEIELTPPRTAKWLIGWVGLDGESSSAAAARFEVRSRETELFRSERLSAGDQAMPVAVAVKDVERLLIRFVADEENTSHFLGDVVNAYFVE